MGVVVAVLRACRHPGIPWASKDIKHYKMKVLSEEDEKCVLASPVGASALASLRAWQDAIAARCA